jgi:hypothetical protein
MAVTDTTMPSRFGADRRLESSIIDFVSWKDLTRRSKKSATALSCARERSPPVHVSRRVAADRRRRRGVRIKSDFRAPRRHPGRAAIVV